MYYAIGASVSSLHRESTDSLISTTVLSDKFVHSSRYRRSDLPRSVLNSGTSNATFFGLLLGVSNCSEGIPVLTILLYHLALLNDI